MTELEKTAEQHKSELFDQIFAAEGAGMDYYELEELREEYHELCKADCVAQGDHFKRIISSGGNDVCFRCGATA